MQHPGDHLFDLQYLEPRRLLSGGPRVGLSIADVPTADGVALRINANRGDDDVQVASTRSGLVVTSRGGWQRTYRGVFTALRINLGPGNDRLVVGARLTIPARVLGGEGNDTITTGGGADTIYAGDGTDRISAGAGDDLIVTLDSDGGRARDSRHDRLTGGRGFDSFWLDADANEIVTDASAAEVAAGAVHRATGFASAPHAVHGRAAAGAAGTVGNIDVPDPRPHNPAMSFRDFSRLELFTDAGPGVGDVRQGTAADCYFLAAVGSVAAADPQVLRQSIAPLGDGTYVVRLYCEGRAVYVHVDADLPVKGSGAVAYAQLGAGRTLWVALLEKAYAMVRDPGDRAGTYATLDGGWMAEAFDALGVNHTTTWAEPAESPEALARRVTAALEAGKAVTLGTRDAAAAADATGPLLGSHAYIVTGVDTADSGSSTFRLRNPWGYDGRDVDANPNDGDVRATAEQVRQAMWAVVIGDV